MKKSAFLPRALVALAALPACCAPALAAEPTAALTQEALFDRVSQLDTAVFDAFNHCSDPAQLRKHADYFDPNVEFYHDTGGVTWTRDAMLANTAKYVCGNFRRERVPGSLKVYPIKDFGAVAQGMHKFCRIATGKCEGMADFVILWRQKDGEWEITRVLSYGHRALADSQ